WRRSAENILEDPFPANHRRGPIGTRGARQNRALTQQTAAHTVFRQRHPPESFAKHAWNSVVPGETFVQERVVGIQQIEHAAIFAEDAFKKQRRLAFEGLAQIVVKVKKHL